MATEKERDQTTANASPPKAEPQASSAVDPEKLLSSANGASGTARNAWLAFLGLLAYFLVTLAGVSHVDLLLNSPVVLPIAQVKIPLFSFFLAAPFLFLLVHLGLLVQHAMLAHKYQHFSLAIGQSEEEQVGDHPARKLVHNYVFSQMLAGSRPPWPLHMLMRLMVFVTFSLLPLIVLLYFQIKFLPSHDVAITYAHRIAILLDLAVLIAVRPFVAMPFLRPNGKRLSLGNLSWRWEISYVSLGIAGFLGVVVVLFSLLVATVPGAWLDRTTAQWWPSEVESNGRETREAFAPTRWLFEGEPDPISGTITSVFSRNLIVTDKDLVEKKDFEKGERSLSLRGRNLRFAAFDRSDLRHADLYGSDLRGASARGSLLDQTDFEQAQLQGANLRSAQLQGANLRSAQLQGANLGEAKLQGVDLQLANLRKANLVEAQLQGADLWSAQLQGANLRWSSIWQAWAINEVERFERLAATERELAKLRSQRELLQAQLGMPAVDPDKSAGVKAELVKVRAELESKSTEAAEIRQQAGWSPFDFAVPYLPRLLSKDIRDGNISIMEANDVVTIRIQTDDLFDLGSADRSSNYLPLMARIGTALKDFPGKVLVTAHTDNVPNRSKVFPSNYLLSFAQAFTVQNELKSQMPADRIFVVEGRGDVEPVSPNNSAENQARNRRVEILVLRERR